MSVETEQTDSSRESATEGKELLRVENLSKQFGGLIAVDNLSFSVNEGEILGFIGPNGAGKSTTFNCIVGTHTPTGGTVQFKGQDLTGAPAHVMVQRGLGRTFQTSRPLGDRNVLDNIAFAEAPKRSSSDQPARTAEEICQLVGLGDEMQKMPDELTHAGLIRLEIGRALATRPDLMLVDEPFAGLSAGEVEDLSALIRDLHDEGMTFIVVDHNMRGLLTLIDRAIVIHNGAKIADGSTEEIKNNTAVQEAYMGEEGISSSLEKGAARTAGTSREIALRANDLSVSYGQASALRDIDLEVPENDLVALIGPNGAGKTTFANAISGFLPYNGSVTYESQEVATLGQSTLVERGLVHCTEKRDLFDYMSVEDNLRLGASIRGRDAVTEQLQFVYDVFPRLEERKAQVARTMSGGEQQMLAIGRALMSNPELLVLDEPTLGLAPIVLEDISDALDTIQEEGVTILLTEQNVTFALEHADKIYLLENGEIVHSGTPAEFQNIDYIKETYLGE